jgi:ferritin
VALSAALQQALNDQINKELGSAYVYLSMSAWCEEHSLPGCASWMRTQSREEVTHAMKIYDHVVDRGGQVRLQAIAQPPAEFTSTLHLFEQVRHHEQLVTASINALYGLAQQERDYASQVFLEWFITEQVEEEKNSSQIVDGLKMIGDNRSALLMLDRELGRRGAEDGE